MTAKSKMAKTDPNAQQCATCSSNKTPVPTNGKVESLKGKQVIKVNITAGTYLPNRFVAKAGTPTTVVFSVRGTAAGCLATPTFKSLNKSVNVPRGTKSLDLGSLAPGTYKFTCSMGMNAGQIVVQ